MDKNTVLVAGAIVFREVSNKPLWLVVKQGEDEGWEFPKTIVRKGESSVRTVLRLMGEKASISARVLEEAGRAGGVTTINSKTLPQRHIFYLMVAKASSGKPIGFSDSSWIEYQKAVKKLASKREMTMLKQAKDEYKKWKKFKKLKPNKVVV
ncbi:MAG: hypothetical protein US53_C0022G0008 [Candidatus Woesebacteria bacterium GW2011_GWA1_37_7]|uniref:Nudix hydrolase domain-containing protein n=2 Tax=Candidatus Woeseibacteriota TaxID=1752722 RepID=A0A0G0H214_9BACT|nr:MAG: hypothetical protein US53_C0022G0008 [Candidatus Woesebacteria bacterium GW2011_GWA1_37_7]